jgi:hypothetical protein
MAAASSHMVTGPEALPRATSDKMEYCVDFMPTGANAMS